VASSNEPNDQGTESPVKPAGASASTEGLASEPPPAPGSAEAAAADEAEQRALPPSRPAVRKPVPAPAAAAQKPVDAIAPPNVPKRWYVVQVYSGYEQKVKASLGERIRQAGADSHFGNILIPTETVHDASGKTRKTSSKTFYPGYIFVEMALTDEAWHVVRDTAKVTGFVGGRNPQPVPSPEIQSVVQQVEEGAAKPRPRVMFAQGDHVRVNDGAFANFTGTVEEVKPEKQKVRVLVSIFGRATPVELDYAQVEKTA
jgi:transcriptional antiterminator NusG